MALATRELELILIAKDRASATLARVGGAMAILGGAAVRTGIEAAGFFVDATQEAIEFRRQVALAFTQLEIPGGTYEDILNMIRDTARETAVPLEELTEVAYDIFSTLTLDNMQQGQELMDEIAMSAVAGQAPARDIGRAVIAWTNALNIASPRAEDFRRILDVQFELVRKGAGTYTEFAGVIGKAIPPFVAAGQGVEELGGSLAFLTRNGLSAAEAATSASRGVELLYGPKAIEGLRKIGIAVEDENGQFRKMDDLLADVVERFRGMGDAERKLQFKEIFGQGRIQARRFFDVILQEGNFEEFLFLLDEMRGSSGEVAEAFDIMMAEPSVQLDIMKNRFTVLRQEIGDVFIPFLTSKLMPALDQLLDWWEDLDEMQKDNLVRWAAFGTLFVIVGGALATVVGLGILFLGILQAFVGSFGAALLLGGGVVGVIAALAGAIALAILDWEKFVEIFGPWWERAVDFMQPVVDWIETNWPEAWEIAEEAWQGVVDFFSPGGGWEDVWDNMKTTFTETWEAIKTFWETEILPPWEGFTTFVTERVGLMQDSVEELVGAEGFAAIPPAIGRMVEDATPLLGELSELFRNTMEAIVTAIGTQIAIATWIWTNFGTRIVRQAEIWWGVVTGVIEGFLSIINGILNIYIGIFTLDWSRVWQGFLDILEGFWGIILSFIEGALGTIFNIFDAELPSIEFKWETFWSNLKSTVAEQVPNIMQILAPLPTLLWRLSPWSRGSPPLVEQVRTGLRAITSSYESELKGLRRTATSVMPDITSMLTADLSASPGLAFAGLPVGQQPQGIGSRIDTNIDRQVNVDKVISQADPREIASAIAWEALNS